MAPKGTMSCRTQGDFHLSARADFRPERTDFRSWGERTEKRTNKRTNERKSPCFLQDIDPFRAAALLPLTPFHNHASRATGIADHILPLGDLLIVLLEVPLLIYKLSPKNPSGQNSLTYPLFSWFEWVNDSSRISPTVRIRSLQVKVVSNASRVITVRPEPIAWT